MYENTFEAYFFMGILKRFIVVAIFFVLRDEKGKTMKFLWTDLIKSTSWELLDICKAFWYSNEFFIA